MPEGMSNGAVVEQNCPECIHQHDTLLFNLIPVPPLDGSHVMRHVVGMSEETYLRIAHLVLSLLLIIVINIPGVGFISSENQSRPSGDLR